MALAAVQGYRWPRRNLTYNVSRTRGSDMPRLLVWRTVRSALNAWAATGFTFKCKFGQSADIILSFREGEHGCGYPFDGPHGVLANAFFPHTGGTTFIEGDVHFDASEMWAAGGYSLPWVAKHELGHALGLDHIQSVDPASGRMPIMYPYYQEGPAELTGLDVQAIQNLYAGVA